MATQPHILVTGAGAPGAPGILSCLQSSGLFRVSTADANPDAVGGWLGFEFHTLPFAEEANFVTTLLHICQNQQIDCVLPLVTRELNVLAQHRDEFTRLGIQVMVNNEDVLSIANHKGRLYNFLYSRKILVPTYKIIHTLSEYDAAVNDFNYPSQELAIKPCEGNGSRGFRILTNDLPNLLFTSKPNNIFTTAANYRSLLSQISFPPLLLTNRFVGDEYSVDCLCKYGVPKLIIPRVRTRMREGISIAGTIQPEPEVITYCNQLIRELQLHGNVGIQLFYHEEQGVQLLEINPRLQGTTVALMGAGVNMPALGVQQQLGLPIDFTSINIAWGTRFQRYYTEVFQTPNNHL